MYKENTVHLMLNHIKTNEGIGMGVCDGPFDGEFFIDGSRYLGFRFHCL